MFVSHSRSFGPVRVLGTLLALVLATTAIAQTPALRVTGADEELTRNIRALIVLPSDACDASPARLQRYLTGVRQRVVRAARALGYYQLRQDTRFVTDPECWALEVAVEPGPPVRLGAVAIEVIRDPDRFVPVLQASPLVTGAQLHHGRYEQMKSNLSARAIELGYFDARFERSELRLDLVRSEATVDIRFDPGERYRFGEIRIQPLQELDTRLVERFVAIEPGTPYDTEGLIDLRQALNDSQLFNAVAVTPVLDAALDQAVPIQVSMQPRPRRVYGAGAGITTDIGPRVRVDYTDRYLTPMGHRLDIQGAASPIQQQASADYSVPLRRPANERLRLSLGGRRESPDTFEARSYTLGATYSTLGWWQSQINHFLAFQHDESRLGEGALRTLVDTSDLFVLGSNLTRTTADDLVNPRSGWRAYGQVRGAAESLLSTTSFAQLYLTAKRIQPLGAGRVLGKLELAGSWVPDLRNLPVSMQYFAGGDQSVRGYAYQSLGPIDAEGRVLGGKHLVTAGLEYDHPVRDSWRVAVFADAGNAFNDFAEFTPKTGVGFGVRWISPIGPVRLDLASALDDDRRWRIHITMGPDL